MGLDAMSRWYRAYEGTVTDAKLGEVALVASCSRSVAIAAWHAILESASIVNDGGRYDTTVRRVAVILCEPVPLIAAVFEELTSLGMIGDGIITAWARRQYESDSSTERSRKHRAAKQNGKATPRNADATLQEQPATPPETDTDTEKEVVEEARALALIEPAEPPAPDLLSLNQAACRAAGVKRISPNDIAANLALIGEWITDGAAPAEILTTIAASVEAATEPIHSLKYFSAAIRQTVARGENQANVTSNVALVVRRKSPLRGSRPDPALDLLYAARAALGSSDDRSNDWGDGRPLSPFVQG